MYDLELQASSWTWFNPSLDKGKYLFCCDAGFFQVGHMSAIGHPNQLAVGQGSFELSRILGAKDEIALSPQD